MTTKEKIWAAADELDAAGGNPTLAGVRKALGGGSYSTISEAMAEWRARRAEKAPIREPLPPNLLDQLNQFGADLWSFALEYANGRLASEREALESVRSQLEAEKAEATELADQVVAELDLAKARVEALEASSRASEAQSAKLHAQLTVTSERAATAETRADELGKRTQDLNTELERVNVRQAELVQANERLGQERLTLESARAKIEAERNEMIERLRREREESTARLQQHETASAGRIERMDSELRELRVQLTATAERAAAAEGQHRELASREGTLQQEVLRLQAQNGQLVQALSAATVSPKKKSPD